MTPFQTSGRQRITLIIVLSGLLAMPPAAFAKSPVKMTKLEGMVDLSTTGASPYVLEGVASHLGKYQAYGEVEFMPGEEDGSLIGVGPVVFQAANGDFLVGVATWEIDPTADDVAEAHVHFAWAESATFSDGTVVSNTGRFVDDRPPGLIIRLTVLEQIILILLRG